MEIEKIESRKKTEEIEVKVAEIEAMKIELR